MNKRIIQTAHILNLFIMQSPKNNDYDYNLWSNTKQIQYDYFEKYKIKINYFTLIKILYYLRLSNKIEKDFLSIPYLSIALYTIKDN